MSVVVTLEGDGWRDVNKARDDSSDAEESLWITRQYGLEKIGRGRSRSRKREELAHARF